jgi:hypothetical protein
LNSPEKWYLAQISRFKCWLLILTFRKHSSNDYTMCISLSGWWM